MQNCPSVLRLMAHSLNTWPYYRDSLQLLGSDDGLVQSFIHVLGLLANIYTFAVSGWRLCPPVGVVLAYHYNV